MGKWGSPSNFSGAVVKLLGAATIVFAVIIGAGLGLSLAETSNIKNQENFVEFAPALPTKILDINGVLITEFSSDEKREMVALSELPRHLVYAVLSREDPDFYNHRGFSVRAITRAVVGQITGREAGGGSTITQQVAGTLYTDRSVKKVSRKIKELWWALQMERRYTKNEILEMYLNIVNMGPGTYGVEAASKYFFRHSASEATLAESALLSVLLSGPSRFNPYNNPELAMDRMRRVLERMVQFGYATTEEANDSYDEYWANFDWSRPSTAAYFHRDDKAPWFSEYVRRELETIMYGSMDYFRDGYTVHTTLDIRHQEVAVKLMTEGLAQANRKYAQSMGRSNAQAEKTYIPIVELLSLYFDLDDIHATSRAQGEQMALSRYTKTINPVVDMAAIAFGIPDLKIATEKGFGDLKVSTEQNVVEGALISIENETGYITAIVGGSKFDESNQLIRATQGLIQPGSAFKPLYYSAAIDSRKFTPATMIYDVPVVFHNEDGTPYVPLNFRGEWKGTVLVYDALSKSMNVPSLKILDEIGFDAAINRSSALLGYTDQDYVRRNFPRVYPLGLGIISTNPLRMARAFSIFGNQGRDVTTIAIRSVENRSGQIVLDPERDVRLRQRRQGATGIQVISPQNAYIMTRILEKTVDEGTLAHGAGWGSKFSFKDANGKTFKMPAAGKTGTPQNWSDAWAVGYTPYYTTAIWFGFDKPGNSLGVDLTGSSLAGPIWGDYMREIHQGLPYREFAKPSSGIVEVTVCAKSGHLKTAACNEGDITLPFLEGTQPTLYCDQHGGGTVAGPAGSPTRTPTTIPTWEDEVLQTLTMPALDPTLFPELQPQQQQPAVRPATTPNTGNRQGTNRSNTRQPARQPSNSRNNNNNRGNNNNNNTVREAPLDWDFNNNNNLLDPPEPVPNIEISAPPQNEAAANDNEPFYADFSDYVPELPSYNPLSD